MSLQRKISQSENYEISHCQLRTFLSNLLGSGRQNRETNLHFLRQNLGCLHSHSAEVKRCSVGRESFSFGSIRVSVKGDGGFRADLPPRRGYKEHIWKLASSSSVLVAQWSSNISPTRRGQLTRPCVRSRSQPTNQPISAQRKFCHHERGQRAGNLPFAIARSS